MRVLLDGCVPRRLGRELPGHVVQTAPELGWGDLNDGALLGAMTGQFDILITVDKRLPSEQRIAGRPFSVVVLHAPSNRLADLRPLVPTLLEVLGELLPGQVREVAA